MYGVENSECFFVNLFKKILKMHFIHSGFNVHLMMDMFFFCFFFIVIFLWACGVREILLLWVHHVSFLKSLN